MKKFIKKVVKIALILCIGFVFVQSETHADLKEWWEGFSHNATGIQRTNAEKIQTINKFGE